MDSGLHILGYKNRSFSRDARLIVAIFILSRIVVYLFGIRFQPEALFKYWQYLDFDTLKSNLLAGVWYDHAQPPFFNLLLGSIIKITGSWWAFAFSVFFKMITLANTLILLAMLKRVITQPFIPLILCLVYLLSPATIIFENELFYTSFLTFLFLLCARAILKLQININWKTSAAFFIPLTIICLSRSMYHLAWLFIVAVVVTLFFIRKNGAGRLALAGLFSIAIVACFYVKNQRIFGKFSTSTWIGMNLSRNVFHYESSDDSSRIEAILPFSEISVYKPYITGKYEQQLAGLNDADLLREFKKNGGEMNMHHVSYIEVSDLYLDACKKQIKANPSGYIKNVAQSALSYFAPATRYPLAELEAKKMKYYDAVYSFNPSHFASGLQQRRIALGVSALPKLALYAVVVFVILAQLFRQRFKSLLNLFIISTIGYIFLVSSLVEHYENMRFRYETEPLFYILLAQVVAIYMNRNKLKTATG